MSKPAPCARRPVRHRSGLSALAMAVVGVCALSACRELGNLRQINAQQERRIVELTSEMEKIKEESYRVKTEKERQSLEYQARIQQLSQDRRSAGAKSGAGELGERERVLNAQVQELQRQVESQRALHEQQDRERTNQLEALRQISEALRQENAQLKAQLGQAGIAPAASSQAPLPPETPAEKAAILEKALREARQGIESEPKETPQPSLTAPGEQLPGADGIGRIAPLTETPKALEAIPSLPSPGLTPEAAGAPSGASPALTPLPSPTISAGAATSPDNQRPDLQRVGEELASVLREPLARGQVLLERTPAGVTVVLWSAMVFSENGSVAPRIEACLKAVGGAFGRDKSGTVLIEAHCDKPGSQGLTADQAVQVARFMTQNSALDSQRLRAVGRADSAPRFAAASQESALGHNSRIELSLRAR